MMDCERYDANVFEVIDLINHDYPRGGIAMPGLTAGTCLRKDFVFSEERSNSPGMLLAVSRVHEAVPLFLVEGIQRRLGSLSSRKVAVLGLTFKRNTDDERDSLSPKLIRLLERELADVAVCDPRAPTPTQPLADAVHDADVVIIATNHSDFETPEAIREIVSGASEDCLLVDPWNALGTSQVFGYVAEAAAMLGAAGGVDTSPRRYALADRAGSLEAEAAAPGLELGEHLVGVDASLRRQRPGRSQRSTREQPHGRRRRRGGRDDRPAEPEVRPADRAHRQRPAVGRAQRRPDAPRSSRSTARPPRARPARSRPPRRR